MFVFLSYLPKTQKSTENTDVCTVFEFHFIFDLSQLFPDERPNMDHFCFKFDLFPDIRSVTPFQGGIDMNAGYLISNELLYSDYFNKTSSPLTKWLYLDYRIVHAKLRIQQRSFGFTNRSEIY